jgi:hydroxyethylthiazole kinase
VRGNASEIIALAGGGSGGRGVDSADDVDAALAAAASLAGLTGGVIAVSGPVDIITDGRNLVRVANGTALLTRVTGGGCALGAVMAAFAAVHDDSFASTVAATTVYTIAAELAAQSAAGPGSFASAFIDALAEITPDDIAARAVLR